jgi:hypothetical protein
MLSTEGTQNMASTISRLRTWRALAGAIVLVSVPFAAPAIAADAKAENEAKKLDSDAMDVDFLSLDYPAAKKKLDSAIAKCGKEKCSASIVSMLHRDLGIVAINMGDTVLGDTAFKAAVKADASVTMPRDYLDKPEVKSAWEAAKGKGSSPDPKPTAEPKPDPKPKADPKPEPEPPSKPTPAPEDDGLAGEGGLSIATKKAPAGFELPVWVEVSSTTDAVAVKVAFKTDEMDRYRPIDARKVGGKFVAVLPCQATSAVGTLKVYARAYDAEGAELDHVGTLKAPLTIKIVEKLASDDEAPLLPGDQEPQKCSSGAEHSTKKPEGSGCESDDECGDGLACVDDGGDAGKTGCSEGQREVERAAALAVPKFWIGADFEADLFFLGSETQLCDVGSSWSCTQNGQDVGTPATNAPVSVTSNAAGTTAGGATLGTLRVMLSADYFVIPELTLGVRLGYAFGGSPSTTTSFMPYHAELRLQYFLMPRGVRPYVMVAGGLAEFDPHIVIKGLTQNDGTPIGDVDGYRRVGQGFAAAGGGLWFGIGQHAAINLGLKALIPLPTFTFGVAGEVGVKFGI